MSQSEQMNSEEGNEYSDMRQEDAAELEAVDEWVEMQAELDLMEWEISRRMITDSLLSNSSNRRHEGAVGIRPSAHFQSDAEVRFKQEQGIQLQRKEFEERMSPRFEDAAAKRRVNAREMAGTKTGKALFQPGGKSF